MSTITIQNRNQTGQAYIEFLITFTVFVIFSWSLLGLAKMMDLEYSSQQARRFIGWETEVIGQQAGQGAIVPTAARIERLFFEHPLAGYGYIAGTAPLVKSNTLWEDTTPDSATTLPASLQFENNAVSLSSNTRVAAGSSIVQAAANPVFAGSQFAVNANYRNPTVVLNLRQVPYLMEDDTAAANPRMLDQSNTVRINPSATGGVITETFTPLNEAELVANIGPTASRLELIATEFWLASVGAFQTFMGQNGAAAYPFEEVTVIPLNNFFQTTAPQESNILPRNRVDP